MDNNWNQPASPPTSTDFVPTTNPEPSLPNPLSEPELPPPPPPLPPPPPPISGSTYVQPKRGGWLGNLLLYVVLFIIGIGLSVVIKQNFPNFKIPFPGQLI